MTCFEVQLIFIAQAQSKIKILEKLGPLIEPPKGIFCFYILLNI